MDRPIVETCKIRIIYQRDFRAFRLCFSLAFFLPGTLERLTCRRTRKPCFSVSIRNIADEHSAARRQQITGSVDEQGMASAWSLRQCRTRKIRIRSNLVVISRSKNYRPNR